MLLQRLRTLFSLDVVKDDESARIARFLQMITSWGIPGLLIIFGVRMISGESLISSVHEFLLVLILSFGTAKFLIRRGYLHFTSLLLILIAWGGVTSVAWGTAGLHDASLIGYLVIIFMSSILLGRIESLSIFIMSIASIWWLAYVDTMGFRKSELAYNPYVLARNLTISLTASGSVIYYVIGMLRISLLHSEKEIAEHLQAEFKLSQQAVYLNALHETTLGIVNRLEIRPLLESILTRACKLVEIQDGLIELILPDGSALKLELGIGVIAPFEGTLTAKGQGLTGRVWEEGKLIIINDYSKWEYRVPGLFGEFHAMLGLPLKSGDDVIGVLGLLHRDPNKTFIPEQSLLLERFAALASLAINNARLYEESQKELMERRFAQTALRDSEERFRRVFHSSPIAISITSLEDGRLLDANYAYWDLTGYDPNTSIGKDNMELTMWKDAEERVEFVEKLKKKRSLYNVDNQFKDLKGKTKSTISFYEVIQIGEQECILSMFYDMSGQKRMMEALQKSEARTRALLDAVPDMIVELSVDGVVHNMVPPKGMAHFMPVESFVGENIRNIFSKAAVQQTLFAIKRTIETNQMNAFEFEGNMGGEKRMMEARLVASGQRTALMIIRDIAQQKEIESEREKLIVDLEIANKESETLREGLAGVVGTFEFKEIIQRILDQISRVIPYDTASVWQVDGDKQKFIIGRNLPSEFFNEDVVFITDETNSALPILRGEVPYILNNNVQAELPDFKEKPHTYVNSWLAIPLKTKGRIIGLIALDGKNKGQFNEHHAELVVTFANQVAIALENASLFTNLQSELEYRKNLIDELKTINAEAETLRESTAIVAATLQIPETVQRVLEQIKRVVQYDSASVWLYQGETAIMVGANGLPSEMGTMGEYIRSADTPDYRLWKYEDEFPYILLDNVHDDYPLFRNPPFSYIHGWLGVPLQARGKLTGFIALDSRTPGKFSEHDVKLARTFAEQVSVALENARLFSDLQAELEERSKLISELEIKNVESETLRESSAVVAATLDISETVQRILEQIKRVVQYDSTSAWLYDGEKVIRVGAIGLPPEMETKTGYLRSTDSPDYRFWGNREEIPYILLGNLQDSYPIFRKPPLNYIYSWLGISLRVRGKLIGFIALDSRTPGKFTEHDAELARTFAEQVSIALENARLFSDLQAELTSRKELIDELESKNAELERFAYTVSHDLKSPLFTIRGFLGYLEQDALDGNYERLKSDMQRIVDATNKMQNLLNDLLELSRVGRVGHKPEIVSFTDLAREAVELVQGRILERSIAVRIDETPVLLFGDKVRLLEVIQNLVDNATKFMGDQKEPSIEIGQAGDEDGKSIFYVRDNGIGISPEHHERIFGLFNKLDVKADGTGIGLALVKRIIEVHGGRIWVESDAGKGSTFFFTLPSKPEADSVI